MKVLLTLAGCALIAASAVAGAQAVGPISSPSITDTGLTPGTNPICPNGIDGSFTTDGCSGGGGSGGIGTLINVTAAPYNAVCNSTTDDTTALQAALTAAKTANTGIYIPAGRFCKHTLSLDGTGAYSGLFIESDPGPGQVHGGLISALTEAKPAIDFGGCNNCGVMNVDIQIPTESTATVGLLFSSGNGGEGGGFYPTCVNSNIILPYPSTPATIGIVAYQGDQAIFDNCHVFGSTAVIIGNGLGGASAITSKFYSFPPASAPGYTEISFNNVLFSAVGTGLIGPALEMTGVNGHTVFGGQNYLSLFAGTSNTAGIFEIDGSSNPNQLDGWIRTEDQAGIDNVCAINMTGGGYVGGGTFGGSLNVFGPGKAICGSGDLNKVDWNFDSGISTLFDMTGTIANSHVSFWDDIYATSVGSIGNLAHGGELDVANFTTAQVKSAVTGVIQSGETICTGSNNCPTLGANFDNSPNAVTTFQGQLVALANTAGTHNINVVWPGSFVDDPVMSIPDASSNTVVPSSCSLFMQSIDSSGVIHCFTSGAFTFPSAVGATLFGATGALDFGAWKGYISFISPSSGSALAVYDFLGESFGGSGATFASRSVFDGIDAVQPISGDQAVYGCDFGLTSGTTNHCIHETVPLPNEFDGDLDLVNTADIYVADQSGTTGCAQFTTGTGKLINTGTPCGSGGLTYTSPTLGYIPKVSNATAPGTVVNSLLDDGATTPNTLTYTGSGGMALTGSSHGIIIPAGTAVAPASGEMVLSSDPTVGNGLLSENGAAASRICTAANGICAAPPINGAISSATGGSGTGTITCLTASCTNISGTYSVAGGTFTTGTALTLVWPTTTAVYKCWVSQNGGVAPYGLGHGVATATGMTVTAGISIFGVTVSFDYGCSPN